MNSHTRKKPPMGFLKDWSQDLRQGGAPEGGRNGKSFQAIEHFHL